MAHHAKKIGLIVFLSAVVVPAIGFAQMYGRGGVAAASGNEAIAGAGTATLHKKPAALRMYIQLSGKGKTLEEALQKLNDRREAATVQIEALKADKDSISFGTPSMSNVQSQQQKQLEQMIRQQMSRSGRKLPKGLKVPKSFNVSATLTAEWPLDGKAPEKLMIATHNLKEKIKTADLSGSKEAKKLSPEEEELAEEMAAMRSSRYGGDEEIKVGEPHFMYVAKVSDEERDKAMADAFANAKQNAQQLAKAAGVQLGPLLSLSGGSSGGMNYSDRYSYERRAYVQRLMAMGMGTGEDEESQPKKGEIVAAEPGSLAYTVHIAAMFGMKK